MTKSSHIMHLHAQGLSTRQIACEVYQISSQAPHKVMASAMAYVRIVTNQRKGSGEAPANKKWRAANPEKISAIWKRSFHKRYSSDPEFRAKRRATHNARRKERYATDPAYRAAEIARQSAFYYRRKSSSANQTRV